MDAFRQIKEISPGTPVVMMTGFSNGELIENALNEGVHSLIHKPFKVSMIIDTLRSVLKTEMVLVAARRGWERESWRQVLEQALGHIDSQLALVRHRRDEIEKLSGELEGPPPEPRLLRDRRHAGDLPCLHWPGRGIRADFFISHAAHRIFCRVFRVARVPCPFSDSCGATPSS
ncbi:MAG: hypothetical protein IH969_10070 [Candidatus Krumholzibacteriota bacterium]|nr:hypothetical protein [Candidatus Krumholzibacteriota bacterium]